MDDIQQQVNEEEIATFKYRILKECGLKIISTRKFHIFSALMLDFGKCENDAAWYAKFDVLGSYLPFINNHGSNIIVHCIKL